MNDLISRKAAIDALDKRFDSIPMEQTTEILLLRKDLRELPSAQPEKHTETHSCDLIDRQAAIKAITDLPNCYNGYSDTYDKAYIIGTLEGLPPAQPERKKGQWIKMSDSDGGYWACSECGKELMRIWHYDASFDLFPRLKSIDRTNYCPNCGSKMEGAT